MKIEWARYIDGENSEEIYYQQLDNTLYNSQYIDHLYCITENCKAEIKFTERKNGVKFFSTMNGQGDKHLIDCPFYLHIDGEVVRKKLLGTPVAASVSDDWVLNTLLNKSKELKNKDKPRKIIKNAGTTKKVVETDEENVPVPVDGGSTSTVENGVNIRFGSINSNFVTKEYLGERKRIIGTATHAEFVETEDGEYGFIRLSNDNIQINAYFPAGFYADTRVTTKTALLAYLNIISKEISLGRKITVISFGMLEEVRNGNGININVLHYKHILANEDQYYRVITSGVISDDPYPE